MAVITKKKLNSNINLSRNRLYLNLKALQNKKIIYTEKDIIVFYKIANTPKIPCQEIMDYWNKIAKKHKRIIPIVQIKPGTELSLLLKTEWIKHQNIEYFKALFNSIDLEKWEWINKENFKTYSLTMSKALQNSDKILNREYEVITYRPTNEHIQPVTPEISFGEW